MFQNILSYLGIICLPLGLIDEFRGSSCELTEMSLCPHVFITVCPKAWLWFSLFSLLMITEPSIFGKQLLTLVFVHLHFIFVHLLYPIVVLRAQLRF